MCAPPFKDQGDMTCQLSLHHRCPVYGLKTRRDVGWPYRGQGSDSQAGDVLALFLVKEKIRSCGALYLPDSASQTFQTKLNIFSKVQGPLDSWGRSIKRKIATSYEFFKLLRLQPGCNYPGVKKISPLRYVPLPLLGCNG